MKSLDVVRVAPPPADQQVCRGARFAAPGERKTRYSLPHSLSTHSPIGYRTRVSLTIEEANAALGLLCLKRPERFVEGEPLTDGELFDEGALGVLSARQSTNFRGHRTVTLGPAHTHQVATILRSLGHLDAPVLDNAGYVHVALCRPYRTAFTKLLTFIGHRPIRSVVSVPRRLWGKWRHGKTDIPTIGYLTELHVGIFADAVERAAVIGSGGTRQAQVHLRPFSGRALAENASKLEALYHLCGVDAAQRRQGWVIAFVAQVGTTPTPSPIAPQVLRKIGADLLAFRSERVQPGVNHEPRAPAPYQARQDMDVSEPLTVMCGRAAYNAFCHWTGVDRDEAKALLLLERVDVLSPHGKRRLREIRGELGDIAERIAARLPKWADLPTGRALTRNVLRGKRAFALAGQRIYIVGTSRTMLAEAGIDFTLAVRAIGAAASRGALYAELMGVTLIPDGCDMLAGVCLMAGPINQNDIGKSFFGYRDLLAGAHPDVDPTSLLIWTLKAKTVADPIGNEEQLMSAERKGALVDLRCGPEDAMTVVTPHGIKTFRPGSEERAFAEIGNFVVDPQGVEIQGNRGHDWIARNTRVFS